MRVCGCMGCVCVRKDVQEYLGTLKDKGRLVCVCAWCVYGVCVGAWCV